jgi:pimeloyl-ACP methyl ester carboxylesterase
MLHGLSSHARSWDHAAEALAGQYHVIALDQRGHGDTDWAPRYGLGPMAQDLLGFLDALDLPKVTLMGLSMGGLVSHGRAVGRLAVRQLPGPARARSRE